MIQQIKTDILKLYNLSTIAALVFFVSFFVLWIYMLQSEITFFTVVFEISSITLTVYFTWILCKFQDLIK